MYNNEIVPVSKIRFALLRDYQKNIYEYNNTKTIIFRHIIYAYILSLIHVYECLNDFRDKCDTAINIPQ